MLQGKIGITIARNLRGSGALEQAKAWTQSLDAVYVERPHNKTLPEVMAEQGLAALIVLEKDGPRIHSAAGTFAYHAGMAVLRIEQLVQGGKDHFLNALGVGEGGRVLDCTLGLASDAAVASWAVGAGGTVVGVEASSLLHFAVDYGLKHYVTKWPVLDEALRRIKAVQMTAEAYLCQCTPDSFDVVYFDPMFRHPVQGSKAMEALRPLSLEEPLSPQAVELALKAAPKVVIKERSEYILREYGCTEFVGGKYSRVKFGIIRRQQ